VIAVHIAGICLKLSAQGNDYRDQRLCLGIDNEKCA